MMISVPLSAFRIMFKYITNLYCQHRHDSKLLLFLDESDNSTPFAQQITHRAQDGHLCARIAL